jgi:hypothetical protein
MKRNRFVTSTFLALTLWAVGAQADHRWSDRARYARPGQLNREQYFRMLDRNHDGWISPWEYDDRSFPFSAADRDRNGHLSWAEWRDSRIAVQRYRAWNRADLGRVDSQRLSDFLRLDRNDDEFLSPREWSGTSWTFARLDRDDDGWVHITEYLR